MEFESIDSEVTGPTSQERAPAFSSIKKSLKKEFKFECSSVSLSEVC